MARFYSNENIAMQVVTELRRLGHDVLTSLDAGNATPRRPTPTYWPSPLPSGESCYRTTVAIFYSCIGA